MYSPSLDSKNVTKDIAPAKLLTVASGMVTEKYIGSPYTVLPVAKVYEAFL